MIGNNHTKTLPKIELVQGNVLSYPADVLALKFAGDLYGADAAVVQALGYFKEEVRAQLPRRGRQWLIKTQGRITPRQVLLTNVGSLDEFDYNGINDFAFQVLKGLRLAAPETRSLALTLHGVGYGLDEVEALRSELAGMAHALTEGRYPPRLEQITIVELDERRVDRLRPVFEAELARLPVPTQPPLDLGIAVPEETLARKNPLPPPALHRHVFVAMPFADDLEDVFFFGIQPPVHAAGFLCERADLTAFTGEIMNKVRDRIETASYVIAELTGGNPNVFLEVGYAWGKGKPTILLVKKDTPLPFDVSAHRCLIYKNITELNQSLARELHQLETGAAGDSFLPEDVPDSPVITLKLVRELQRSYKLSWRGVHGIRHWLRVRENGLLLCEETGADPKVVELFAFLHDAGRETDGADPHHGLRAAERVDRLQGEFFNLSPHQLSQLKDACAGHTAGNIRADLTVQTCWDADRLDLPRTGVEVNPEYLCTDAAKNLQIIAWATQRSR